MEVRRPGDNHKVKSPRLAEAVASVAIGFTIGLIHVKMRHKVVIM